MAASSLKYNNAQGRVQVFAFDEGTQSWEELGADLLPGPNGLIGDWGNYLSISDNGTVLAVGGARDSTGGSLAGAVHVFEWNATATSWDQRGQAIIGNACEGTGPSDISGDGAVLAVGGLYQTDACGDGALDYAGRVRVFEWDALTSSWGQRGADLAGSSAGDRCGHAVSISDDGSVVAFGCPKGPTQYLADTPQGYGRVFEWDAGTSTWVQRGADISAGSSEEKFAQTTALSGDGTVLALGAPYYSTSPTPGPPARFAGLVRVFAWSCGAWQQAGADFVGESSYALLGMSASLSSAGTVLALGLPGTHDDKDSFSGSYDWVDGKGGTIQVYEWNGGTTSWDPLVDDIDSESWIHDYTYAEAYFYYVLTGPALGKAVRLAGDGSAVAVGGTRYVSPDLRNTRDSSSQLVRQQGFGRTYELPARSATGTPGDSFC